MSTAEKLEDKIDELIRSLGGLERLRDLARLSSLDHLVNLHLLSHLTKLDKIEGLERLGHLEGLQQLSSLKSLDELKRLDELSKLDHLASLEKLDNLAALEKLSALTQLSQLEQLRALDKLDELQKLKGLDSLQNLGGLDRLDHLKYLQNLDRLSELSALTKLDALVDLKELLERHEDKFAKLRHLEALDHLPLLDQLQKLDKLESLDRLSELSRLDELKDELKKVTHIADGPPMALPSEGPLPVVAPAPEVVRVKRGWGDHLMNAFFHLLTSATIAGALLFVLMRPGGRDLGQDALAFLGVGQAQQVNWALEVLVKQAPADFPRHWIAMKARIESEIDRALDPSYPWTLAMRHDKLRELMTYDFSYQNENLKELIDGKIQERERAVETQWRERLLQDIGEAMRQENGAAKLGLWNQLKDISLAGRWEDLLSVALAAPQDEHARTAALLAIVHLRHTERARVGDILEATR